MAVATYSRVFNFQNQQALTPAAPIPAAQLDAELNAVKIVFDNLIATLAEIQRDDEALANESVGYDQLKPEISVGFAPPLVWATSTAYTTADAVFNATSFYRCLVKHTAGVFATDLAAGKWQLVYNFETIFGQLADDIGLDGWSPEFALESNGEERILKIVDWTGGDGEKPAVDKYVGASGLVDAIGDGVDVRGATGGQGDQGDPGATGDPGADGATWFTGATDPDNGNGANGDFYLQTGTGATGVLGDVWLKAAGAWAIETNIRGASGAGSGDVTGPDGGVVADEIPVFADTTGKEIEGSGVSIGDLLTTADAATTYQPLDADLTAIAALTTTSFGLSLLELADETALENLLDTLANLTSIQGRTVTLADAGADALFGWDDSASAYQNLSATDARTALGVRDVLAANRTYYVRADGSDSNTGLVDSAGGAFLTIQKALDVVGALDISIYDVTIQVGAGTYSTATGNVLKSPLGSGAVIVQGDSTTPANVVVTTTGAMNNDNAGFVAKGPGVEFRIFGFQFTSSGSGTKNAIGVTQGARAVFGKLDFSTGWSNHFYVAAGYLANLPAAASDYTISAGAARHLRAIHAGSFINLSVGGMTATITGTPAFSTAFAEATRGGYIQAAASLVTWTGSATGKRYDVALNAVIDTQGGGATEFPGDVAGTTATGGQYI